MFYLLNNFFLFTNTEMKSLTGFTKVLICAQKLHCRTTVSEECLPMTASTLKYDHNGIIIKRAESLKLF